MGHYVHDPQNIVSGTLKNSPLMQSNAKSIDRWKRFWAKKSSPHNRSDAPDFVAEHGKELRALFESRAPESVLEFGCGTGELYTQLGFDNLRYCGVDFSETMLSEFRKNHPTAKLINSDATAFKDGNFYDLIFLSGVVQYLNPLALECFFKNVQTMMKPSSILVCATVPAKHQRAAFMRGELVYPYWKPASKIVRSYVSFLLKGSEIGYWYSLNEFRLVAEHSGMDVDIRGSSCYLYRFNAVLRKTDVLRNS